MEKLVQQVLTGERALFAGHNLHVEHSIFENGESPLKESKDIEIDESVFKWKYPLWYSQNATVNDSLFLDGARAGIWYTDGIAIRDTTIEAPKTFRHSSDITLECVDMPNASETLWMCGDVKMNNVSAKGDYFAMNAHDITADNLRLVGNYGFDGCRNVKITGSKLISKDTFWNCENVEVYDSYVVGEYIGWNSKNLTFVNCTIESLQGFCYIQKLILKNCRLFKTNLAFEYCRDIEIDVTTAIDSVKNPISGTIQAEDIGEIIFDDPAIDSTKTKIITRGMRHAV